MNVYTVEYTDDVSFQCKGAGFLTTLQREAMFKPNNKRHRFPKSRFQSCNATISSHSKIGTWGTGTHTKKQNADTSTIVNVVNVKLSPISDPGVSHLLPISIKLYQASALQIR